MPNLGKNAVNHDRQAAIAEGRETYIGRPCKHCGNRERRVRKYQCTNCGLERGRVRAEKYRKRNESYREYQREYHKKYAESEHGKAVKAAANQRWRERKKLNKSS